MRRRHEEAKELVRTALKTSTLSGEVLSAAQMIEIYENSLVFLRHAAAKEEEDLSPPLPKLCQRSSVLQ